jgi:two-component system OmpR family sensor kinase
MKKGYLLSLIPLVGGLALGALIENDILPNHVFTATYVVDLAWIVSWAGILVTAVSLFIYHRRQTTKQLLENVRAEEQQHRIRHQQEFLRRLDHELKNPLTIIRLAVANLGAASQEHSTSLERISQQTTRLQRLIKDLRQLSELETRSIETHPLHLGDILKETIDISEADKREQQVNLHIQEVPWPLSTIDGDRDLITLALQNVLGNAFKFTDANGVIDVRAADDGQNISIEIADNGIGITEEVLHLVYEELYRAPNAHHIAGSGLGLSLVKKIMALHNGQVNIRSKPDQGTVVTLVFPLV